MRWYIIRALLVKEWQRHLANRGGIALGLLLVTAAVLLSVFAPRGQDKSAGANLVGGVNHCFVEYDRQTTLITHLKENIPPDMTARIHFREFSQAPTKEGHILYTVGSGGLQIREIRPENSPNNQYTIHVAVWHPDGNPTALAPYETWLWKEVRRWNVARAQLRGVPTPPEPDFDAENQWMLTESHKRFQDQIAEAAAKGSTRGRFEPLAAVTGAAIAFETTSTPTIIPDLIVKREGLGGIVLDIRSAIVTGFVVFALYFTCVYLLPTLNCEERERGILLAQALSPASPLEIVAAKALFYPTAGITLAATIAAVYNPAIVARPFFWLSIFAVAAGFLGIGMTISTLARTQRAAFLGGMCYLMAVSMLLMICTLNSIPFLPYLAVEYHGPRILHAAINGDEVNWFLKGNLFGAAFLGVVWLTVAVRLFRRRGWQ
ncbi:MAG: hypothetical protein C0467_00050 [Planctomycetaceae bacterium]|nr:hypothetical protein [Planctomycetaceae bacterium]